MTIYQYDPKEVTIVMTTLLDGLAGPKGSTITLSGFSDDDFIEVERDEDAFTKKTGVDGFTTRAKNNNRAGKITARIMQSSPSNDDLTLLARSDEKDMTGVVSVTVKDISGNSKFTATDAWVKKFPKPTYKKDVGAWEWVIETGFIDMTVAGNDHT